MNRKLEFVLLVGMIALVFLGRWEGKREADKYYAEQPTRDMDSFKHIIKGYKITNANKCMQVHGPNLFSNVEIEDWGDDTKPCLLSEVRQP